MLNKLHLKKLLKKLVIVLLLVAAFLIYNHYHIPANYKAPHGPYGFPTDLYEVTSYKLYIEPTDYQFLFSHKPASLRIFQKAHLYSHNVPSRHKGRVRARGSHAWHWHQEKPSLRFRIKNPQGPYYLDFINPEDPAAMANPLATNLAQTLQLPYYQSSLCELHINNEHKGIYNIQHTSASNLEMAHNHDGKAIVAGNSWNLEIWQDSTHWEVTPISTSLVTDPEDSEQTKVVAQEIITKLLSLFSRPINPLNTTHLFKTLDFHAMATWSAYQAVIGGIHTDDLHNNFFLLNSQNKLKPIITDPAAFGTLTAVAGENIPSDSEISIYEYLTPIFDLAFRCPNFQFERNKKLYQLATGIMSISEVNSLVDKYEKTLTPLYFKEKNSSALVTVPVLYVPKRLPVSSNQRIKDIARLRNFYKLRNQFLLSQLNQCEANLYPLKDLTDSQVTSYKIQVKGHAPLAIKLNNLSLAVASQNQYKDLQQITKGKLLLYPALGEDTTYDETKRWLITEEGGRLAQYTLAPAPQVYYIFVEKAQEKDFLQQLAKGATNAVTSQSVNVQTFDSYESYSKNAKDLIGAKSPSSVPHWEVIEDELESTNDTTKANRGNKP